MGVRAASFVFRCLWLESAVRDNEAGNSQFLGYELDTRETGFFTDALEFGGGVGIAFRGGGKHHHAEGGWGGRRDAIGVGHKLDDGSAAAGGEGSMHLSHEAGTSGWIEVVEEVRDEDEVVVSAEVGLEGVAGDGVIAIANSHGLGIASADLE